MPKAQNTLKLILILLGAISLLYGIIVFSIIGGSHWFNYAFIILGAAFFALSFLIKQISKLNKAVLIVILMLIGICFVNFAVFEINLAKASRTQYEPGSEAPEWVIVLGAKVDSNRNPKLEFAVRLRKAEELCTSESTLILTGGQGVDEPASEAECAYDYLINRNIISAKEILVENESVSTGENLANAKEIILKKGGSPDDLILIISSNFHLYRAHKLALLTGLSNTCYAGDRGLAVLEPFYCVREYAAYIRESL